MAEEPKKVGKLSDTIRSILAMGGSKPNEDNNSKKKASNPSEKTRNPTQSKGMNMLFKNIFGPLIMANRWQKAADAKQNKLVELFYNPRNDPHDVYKPNSQEQMQVTIEVPYHKPLPESSAEMLQEIAANYDYCTELDVIENFQPKTFISQESREQLDRLPTWLRFLIVFKYDVIHEHYQHRTHHFIKLLANKIDNQRTTNLESFEGIRPDDEVDKHEITEKYMLDYKLLDDETVPTIKKDFFSNDLFRLKFTIWKWKLPKTLEQDWAPVVIHRSATTLRKAMLTQASPAELAMVAEDEKLKRDEEAARHGDVDLDDDDEVEETYTQPSWTDMVADKAGFKEEVARVVDEDLKKIPPGLSKFEKEEELELARQVLAKNLKDETCSINDRHKHKKNHNFWNKVKDHELLRRRQEKKQRKVNLTERAIFRKYSRIWYKNCPKEPIKQAKRLPHHYRFDESFHAYVVALVSSSIFKTLIMIVIIANALVLAVETGNSESLFWAYFFEILDDFFLSVYLVEFLLKIYAHPHRYWRSGFNRFDFLILVVSLFKAITDWMNLIDVRFFKVLVIVRALRILRGISMSVQIQVLITALVETLKTHVLSVLILLFLLMYIASIMAYYLFASLPGLSHPWGDILEGMLRLFSFVTMDGWTTTTDEFEAADYMHSGRVFCLICILLGNFLISNIFIAIIIMQISEATEAFRSRQRDEREEIVTQKKEVVFRRQKLDMRQLLSKQNLSPNADFYYLGSQFLRLLRHDDLVDMNDIPFSPLWMDAFYKGVHRCHHTANLLMNLHRQMADNLLEMYKRNTESRYIVTPIRRGRYNRYIKLKAKLALLRQEFFKDSPQARRSYSPLRCRFSDTKISSNDSKKDEQNKTEKQSTPLLPNTQQKSNNKQD